jgi:vesicle-fusing ATPase
MACHAALQSNIPFVRMLSAESLLGYNEASKCVRIRKTFEEADRSATSLIVIDDLERILEYVPIGPRFSNAILQSLSVLLRKAPAPDHRLFLLCTTSDSLLMRELELAECFDNILYMPIIESSTEMNKLIETLEPTLPLLDADCSFRFLPVKKAIARLERKIQEPSIPWSDLLI